MRLAKVQFASWDKIHFFKLNDLEISENDKVIVKIDNATEIGAVIGFTTLSDVKKENPEVTEEEINDIIRMAAIHDTGELAGPKERNEALEFAKSLKDKYDLPMKFVDVHFSFDRSRITFAFIADGRVDFRNMVKDMTRHFSKSIRLQQIGIRDEANIMGDLGACGRCLCCRGYLKELCSITSDMAEMQQCSHRGSDRISGVCGRLMCCLSYEQKGYEESMKKLHDIGRRVNVDGKKGKVVGHHVLKQSVDVEFEAENGDGKTVIEVDLNRHNK
ncbi:hypothetical protein C0583_02355 [Candidatus Parcubacteria bacterium]|nr:MAG: hypothetical protein C0583_02355 [Candidatus Parcubacteria bacterium]